MKLCLVYNYAQHYRSSIFSLIDKTFVCDFYFGDSMGDVKKMDYSLLNGKVTEVRNYYWFKCVYQASVLPLIRKKYDVFILLGETRCLSTWMFLLLSKFYPKKRVYLWSHGWYGKESRVAKFIKHIFFKLPNGGVFLYGNYAKQLMLKEGFSDKKLFVIHNSLAYEKQREIRNTLQVNRVFRDHFRNDFPTLIFIGRLTPEKKLHFLIDAVKINQRTGHNYNLVFVGTGVMEEELRKSVDKHQLRNRVWFYGACYDENQIGNLIYNADLCVSPGNVGLTAMHSLVFGTPVLTHDNFTYQMPEFEAIVEGKTGMFFEFNNLNSLAENINRWFENQKDRDCVREQCMREIDERWTPLYQLNIIKSALKDVV